MDLNVARVRTGAVYYESCVFLVMQSSETEGRDSEQKTREDTRDRQNVSHNGVTDKHRYNHRHRLFAINDSLCVHQHYASFLRSSVTHTPQMYADNSKQTPEKKAK